MYKITYNYSDLYFQHLLEKLTISYIIIIYFITKTNYLICLFFENAIVINNDT